MRRESRRNSWRLGLSTPILALIVILVGVALALVVAAIAGGWIFGWGTSARVTIERADVLVDPTTGAASIIVDIRNSGGAKLTGCAVALTSPANLNPDNWDPDSVDLAPGQTASFTALADSGFETGTTYMFSVTCTGPGGATVSDQKSAIGHL